MLLFEKYGQHQPLNRQAERFAREGVPLSVSTLADQVGAAAYALMPLYRRIEAHVLSAQRLHGDDTTARSWPGARPISPGSGCMFTTTGHSRVPIRRPRCSTIPATGAANIHARISPHGQGSGRPTPMAATTSSTPPAVDPQPELIDSPLSRSMEWDGVRLDVQIYRLATERGWSLEIVNEAGTSIVWDDLFATDRDADAAFRDTLARDGIDAFLD
jgi:hypothetical protein